MAGSVSTGLAVQVDTCPGLASTCSQWGRAALRLLWAEQHRFSETPVSRAPVTSSPLSCSFSDCSEQAGVRCGGGGQAGEPSSGHRAGSCTPGSWAQADPGLREQPTFKARPPWRMASTHVLRLGPVCLCHKEDTQAWPLVRAGMGHRARGGRGLRAQGRGHQAGDQPRRGHVNGGPGKARVLAWRGPLLWVGPQCGPRGRAWAAVSPSVESRS